MADIRIRENTNKPYQVRFIDRTKSSGYGYRSFLRAREAKAFKAEKDLEEDRGAPAAASLSVPDAINRWLIICETEGTDGNDPVTDYTLSLYRYHACFMKDYAWPCALAELTTPDVVDFRTWLIEVCPSRYVARKTLAYFKTVLSEQVLRGVIPGNVASGIVIKEKTRYSGPVAVPSHADIRALLVAADDLARSKNETIAKAWKRYRPMLYLAVDSGMRPQEYLALTKGHIRDGGAAVEQAIEGDGKTMSVTKTPSGRRFIPLSPLTLDLLADHSRNLADDDLLFPAKGGGWQDRRNWQRRGFNVACAHAGLMEKSEDGKAKPKYRPYDLRHFFASMLIEHIPNIKRIQKMMGHKNIEQTLNTYAHLIDDRQDLDHEFKGVFEGVIAAL